MSHKFNTFLLVTVSITVSVLIGEMVARVIFPQWREFLSEWFMVRSHVPGYGAVTLGRPGFDGYFSQNNGDFRVRIKINGFGLRSSEPVNAASRRVWVVGDSVAFGWGVAADKMLSGRLQRHGPPGAYNISSPGTDVCGYQALVARMPASLIPSAAILVLTLENDIRIYDCAKESARLFDKKRNLDFSFSATKQFLMKHSALYNLGAVVVKRTPVLHDLFLSVGLIKKSHTPGKYFPRLDIAIRTSNTAREIVKLRHMFPLDLPFGILLVPARFELRDKDPFFSNLRVKMAGELRDNGLVVIDPTDLFKEAGFTNTHFPNDGHWSANGHALAAKAIGEWLQQVLTQ